MFATVLLVLSTVVLLLATFGLASILGGVATLPLGLELGFGGLLFGRLNL